jgi:hypothetical protein
LPASCAAEFAAAFTLLITSEAIAGSMLALPDGRPRNPARAARQRTVGERSPPFAAKPGQNQDALSGAAFLLFRHMCCFFGGCYGDSGVGRGGGAAGAAADR